MEPNNQGDSQNKLMEIIEERFHGDGLHRTGLKELVVVHLSKEINRTFIMEYPMVWIILQGRKVCYAGEHTYDLTAGSMVVMVYPMTADFEISNTSRDKPFIAVGLSFDRKRMAEVILRQEKGNNVHYTTSETLPSGIFSFPANREILGMFIKLFEMTENDADTAFLGENMIDEAYYRLLKYDEDNNIRGLLYDNGLSRRINDTVNFINQNIEKQISSEQLATMVNMSQAAFYQNFRKVMHNSPLNYIKAVKLHEAQKYLRLGKNVSETADLVGYNSSSQFTREYKRLYGIPPSKENFKNI